MVWLLCVGISLLIVVSLMLNLVVVVLILFFVFGMIVSSKLLEVCGLYSRLCILCGILFIRWL